MKKKSKLYRLSALILMVCMAITLMPLSVSAASITDDRQTLSPSQPESGDGWTWDGSTLTLNNFQYVGGDGEEGSVFKIQGDAAVNLVGENSFIGEANLTFIEAAGSITIGGEGTLTANNTLEADFWKVTTALIWADEYLTFSGGTLNLTGESYGSNGVTISDGTLNIVTPNMVYDDGYPCVVNAFASSQHLKISGGTMNLKLGTGSTGFWVVSYGDVTDEKPNIEMTGGTITSTGGDCLMMVAYAPNTPAIKVTDGTIKASNMTHAAVMRSVDGGDIIIDGGNYMIDRAVGSVDNPANDEVLIKAADYSAVDEAIKKANALSKDQYKDFSEVEAAIADVVRDKNIIEQAEVDGYATAIENAIKALEYKDADYSAVDAAIEKANALSKDQYKDFSAVEAAIAAVVRDKNITEQSTVDGYATAIENAIKALEYKDADYSAVDAAIEKANALSKDQYKDFSAVEAAIAAVVRDKNITEQAEVDGYATAIENAIKALEYKNADYSAVDEAIEKANALNKDEYKDFSAVEAAIAAVVRGKNITEQAEVDAMAKAINDAIASIEKKPIDNPIDNPAGNPTDDPASTETGDNSNIWLWIALMVVAGGGVIGTTVYNKKEKNMLNKS